MTEDECYLLVTGKTKAQYEESKRKSEEEYRRREEEFKRQIPELCKAYEKDAEGRISVGDMDYFKEILPRRVGDLYHGRTVHSKADGLKLFNKVKVDLIAPPELAMPENYLEKMKNNGFEVREFASIEEYLNQESVAKMWYFTRPQLERMGERILQKQDLLRKSITFRNEQRYGR